MRRARAVLGVAIALALAGSAAADSLARAGRMLSVQDGDSFQMRWNSQVLRVRIAYIDAPEHGQPWADQSREALAALLAHRELVLHEIDRDAYGRIVATVDVGSLCVGCEQVRAGNAWVYRKYARDPKLLELEEGARTAERGLWSLPAEQRTPPWEWRVAQRAKQPSSAMHARSSCDPAPRCDRIASCEEARRLLAKCGPVGLDGDGDGIPCERLCAP